jgi:hypothetical protein
VHIGQIHERLKEKIYRHHHMWSDK